MNKYVLGTLFSSSLILLLMTISSANEIATLRKNTELSIQQKPEQIPKVINDDIKQKRNYPMQPPLIPHHIRSYEVDLKVNKCMSCHARKRTSDSNAPMVSVTHYMDRDGNFLAELSPRRYFCNQCHVTQSQVNQLVENTFEDMDNILQKKLSIKKEQ
ncbi:nitrate reductase cytochrome c-type subunit [Thalassotalea aquiviva]|uniref:nitrate reductase cytochrome c-type subunit n=1 Tax=Thalassotalea aquiviva TaxID=3242415 RepID=UPI00352AD40E